MSARIIGIGNPDRGDDAIGLHVIDGLAGRCAPDVELIKASGDMSRLLDLISGADRVVLVDAMLSGGTPGTVLRIDPHAGPLKSQLETFASSHAFNLAESIELARALGRLPGEVVIYGVEADGFEPGAGLSPAVRSVVPDLVERILEDAHA